MRNPSWFAFQVLQGAMCGLAGWTLAPSIASAMLVGPMILFLFWLIELVFAHRGVPIYVPSKEEKASIEEDFENGNGPFVVVASLFLLVLGGSAAAGIPAAVCTRPLEGVLIGVVALFVVWGTMYVLPSIRRLWSRA